MTTSLRMRGDQAEQRTDNVFTGIQVTLDPQTRLIVDAADGFIVRHEGAYTSRDALFSHIDTLIQTIEGFDSTLVAERVSVLVNSLIVPESTPYRIEDYVVPKFEFTDESLNTFAAFRHDIWIDLSQLAESVTGRVVIESVPQPTYGVSLNIDVLDHASSELHGVKAKLVRVKDIETHVFESIVTDNTRRLYGVSN